MESDKELTINKKNYIEAICETMYDESNEWYEDIYDMPPIWYSWAIWKTVKEEVGITVTFKAIDLEVSILEDCWWAIEIKTLKENISKHNTANTISIKSNL